MWQNNVSRRISGPMSRPFVAKNKVRKINEQKKNKVLNKTLWTLISFITYLAWNVTKECIPNDFRAYVTFRPSVTSIRLGSVLSWKDKQNNFSFTIWVRLPLLPARPAIWIYSAGANILFSTPSNFDIVSKTTVLAGMFTPIANVSVANNSFTWNYLAKNKEITDIEKQT